MKKTDSCANLLPFCFVFHSFKSKGIMVSYHLINPHHRYRLQKVFLIHSAETTEVLSPLPVIILGLTVSRSFVFSSPHAAPNRCILANLVSLHKTSWGISNAPMHHDYFAEVAFLSYCILSCHCSSCQKADIAGKAFYTDSLDRTFRYMLQHSNVASFVSDLIYEIGNKSLCRQWARCT